MASFMSGMAGNVTAFNTVWTYDIYQSYIRPGQPDQHYLRMGHVITVVGILISVACAYVARAFNNIMDMLQLVFGFVNAPLFATFLLGMFWRRATGHGAFCGLLSGTAAAAFHHGLTLPAGAIPGIKGGWLSGTPALHTYPVEMAQNFWAAIYAFTACFVVTVVISVLTRRNKTDEELKRPGLLPHPQDQRRRCSLVQTTGLSWRHRSRGDPDPEPDLLVTTHMQLDIRLPIGLMFGVLGLILTIYGLVTGSSNPIYEKSLGININLWCGLIFVAFAAVMLALSRRQKP